MNKIEQAFNNAINRIEEAGGLWPNRGNHDKNTSDHMLAVAEAAKIHPRSSELLVHAAMMHDMGKEMTAAPREDGNGHSFFKHGVESARIAEELGCDPMVVAVVRHHEWIQQLKEVAQVSYRNPDRQPGEPKKLRRDWTPADPVPGTFVKFLDKLTDGLDFHATVQLYIDLTECDAEGFSPEGMARRLDDVELFIALLEAHKGE